EGDATRGLDVFELLDGGEMAVDQRRIGQWPEVLGRLELGRIGGRKSKWTCSGTCSLTLACQPAWSKTSTICFWGLAPTCWAKAASATSKRGMLTEVAR
ncbi:MAG TPA: hypothetical protein VGP82_14560, partial [Ktedonobacterales bacterium]|nr:hypothetical protein [Ktedonobacterales bacterium]